jgi:hypothetical protein
VLASRDPHGIQDRRHRLDAGQPAPRPRVGLGHHEDEANHRSEAVAADAATPAEPEVIKKGKKEVEGEEGAEAEAKPEKAEKGEKKK